MDKQTSHPEMIKAGHVNWSKERDEAFIWLHDAWVSSIRMVKGDCSQEEFEAVVAGVLKTIRLK